MANTQILKDLSCPKCFYENTFIVQITLNVVMADDGYTEGCSQPGNAHFPERPISDDNGFRDDDPIECHERWGGCGYRGTVGEFRWSGQRL